MAVGDALGAPVEFDPPEQIAGLREELFAFPGGGGWDPGEFTDDTQMSILLAQHLANGQFDDNKLATSWAEWAIHTSTKDVEIQTSQVLSEVARGQHWSVAVSGLPAAAAGNGSLIRVAPVALFQLAHSFDITDLARAQSRSTLMPSARKPVSRFQLHCDTCSCPVSNPRWSTFRRRHQIPMSGTESPEHGRMTNHKPAVSCSTL